MKICIIGYGKMGQTRADAINASRLGEVKSIYEKSDKINLKDLFTKTLSSNQIRTKVKTYEYNKYKPYYFIFEKYKKKYKWLND